MDFPDSMLHCQTVKGRDFSNSNAELPNREWIFSGHLKKGAMGHQVMAMEKWFIKLLNDQILGVPNFQTNREIGDSSIQGVRVPLDYDAQNLMPYDAMPLFQKRVNQNLGSLRQVLIHCWWIVVVDRWWFNKGHCILFGSTWVCWSYSVTWYWKHQLNIYQPTPLKWLWMPHAKQLGKVGMTVPLLER